MDPSWIDLLIQLPLVGVFIWYSLEMQKRIQCITDSFSASLKEHDAAFERRVAGLIASDREMTSAILTELKTAQTHFINHDNYVRENVSLRRRVKSAT